MTDVIIIGQGPAGISAALYTCRAKLSTVVIGKDGGSLVKADKIENYYGLSQPLSGKELLSIGKKQSVDLGAKLIEDEVLNISWNGNTFTAETAQEKHESKALILATGAPRKTPKIQGLPEFEGSGVSYCAVCDAFFFGGKDVAVLGNGAYALHEIQHLLPIAKSVTLLTNGLPLEPQIDQQSLTIIQEPIQSLQGDGTLQKILFKNDTHLDAEGLFIALGTASALDLARKVGAAVENTSIRVDHNMATTIPGFFAAGDCIGGLLQVSTAVAEGAKAAISAIEFLRK